MATQNFRNLVIKGDLGPISQLKEVRKLSTTKIPGRFSTDEFNLINPTPIQLAAAYGHEHLVEYFLRFGADPNYIGGNNSSTLHIAIMKNLPSLVELLLDNNANINVDDSFGMKPIFSAIRWSSKHVLTQILQHDTGIDALYMGDNALHYALKERKVEHALLLVAYGYSFEEPNKDGETPYSLAEKLNLEALNSYLDDELMRKKLALIPKSKPGARKVTLFPLEEEETKPARKPQPKYKKAERDSKDVSNSGIKISQHEVKNDEVFHSHNSQPQSQIFVGQSTISPTYNKDVPLMPIEREDFASIMRRIVYLEQTLSQLLTKCTDAPFLRPRACVMCNIKPGINICPVCGGSFCHDDFYFHVSNGCRPH